MWSVATLFALQKKQVNKIPVFKKSITLSLVVYHILLEIIYPIHYILRKIEISITRSFGITANLTSIILFCK